MKHQKRFNFNFSEILWGFSAYIRPQKEFLWSQCKNISTTIFLKIAEPPLAPWLAKSMQKEKNFVVDNSESTTIKPSAKLPRILPKIRFLSCDCNNDSDIHTHTHIPLMIKRTFVQRHDVIVISLWYILSSHRFKSASLYHSDFLLRRLAYIVHWGNPKNNAKE